MGKIATATSLVSILILLPSFGFSDLIVRDVAGDRTKTGAYFSNALFLRGLLSVAFGVILVGITKIIGYPYDTTLIIYIYGFAYILDALSDVAFSIFNACEKMEYPAALQTGRDIVNVVLSLGAIYLHASLITIVFMSAAACLFKLAASLTILRWQFVRPRLQIDQRLCRRLLVAALPFATLGISALVTQQISTVLLSFHHSEEEVGLFSAASTLIAYLLLVPSVFNQAIFPVFARFHSSSRDALRQAYGTSFKYLLLLGLPLWAGTTVTANQVIALVYGPGFESAALVLRILAFLLSWMFIWANGALLTATGSQTLLAVLNAIGVALNIALALLLIPRFNLAGASVARILPPAIFLFPLTLVCHRRLGMRLPYGLALKSLVATLCMAAVAALSLHSKMHLFVSIFVIAPLVYGTTLAVLGVIGREDLAMLIQVFRKRTGLTRVEEFTAGS
jgi:O-antigen/teichoic acid export membrane protein